MNKKGCLGCLGLLIGIPLIILIIPFALILGGLAALILGFLAFKKPEKIPNKLQFVRKAPIVSLIVGVLFLFFGSAFIAAISDDQPDKQAKDPKPKVVADQPPDKEKKEEPEVKTKEVKHKEPKRDTVKVVEVLDGDTIKVEIDGKKETIRLLLIDTPTKHPNKPVQPFGSEASKYAKELMEGKAVELEVDVKDRDKYGRLLRYVYIKGEKTSVQEKILKKGLARVSVYSPDVKYVDQFRKIEQEAKKKRIGIWSIENYAREDGFHPPKKEEPKPKPKPKPEPKKEPSKPKYNGPYDPFGPDRNCSDFASGYEAQLFYEAAGGPARDPHGLDRDRDGKACDWK